MEPSRPPLLFPADSDTEHLRLLSIFHYVFGGLSLLFALFPLIYVFIGVAVATGIPSDADGPPAGLIGGMFAVVGVLGVLLMAGLGTLQILVGRWIKERRRWTFCFVMACISCVSFPLGTALGVFTIIVLNRPSVKLRFQFSDSAKT